jgi:GT2 family glycosyltransferase
LTKIEVLTKITAIIPTYNEESNIKRALDSVGFADEIIVIDSFSTDDTVSIVKKTSATLLQREFDNFSNQKNFAISKASNDWIFLLDADEIAPKELQDEVLKIASSKESFSAYYIYRNYFFKKTRIRFSGWRRDKVIRLFKKDECRYEGKVHEQIETKGKIGFLSNKINHFSYHSYNRYKSKLKKYGRLQAEELMIQGKIITPYHLILKPFIRFFIQFIIQFGFLDGYRGFVISWLHAFGVWRRYIEVLNLKYSKKEKINSIENFDTLKKEKEVSIIIVNYKSWKHLELCLEALAKIKEDKFSFEVLIVDNKSDDGKLKEFSTRYAEFKFIENSGNNGFANGCNTGALNSVGENLLFLNPDAIASQKAISLMLQKLKANLNFGIVSCNQINDSGFYEDSDRIFPELFTLFGFTRALYRNFARKTKEDEQLVFPNWVSGSVVFISREWFQKINGWNEDYWMYYEDVDLSKKVRDAGGEVALVKDAEIIHNHGGASRINIKTASITKTEVLISKHVYISNHFSGLKQFIMLTLVVLSNVITKTILAILGIVFFFIPKLKLNLYLFLEMMKYYYHSLRKGSWLSSRSMNLPFKD